LIETGKLEVLVVVVVEVVDANDGVTALGKLF